MECSRKVFVFPVSSEDVIVHHNHVSCVMRDFWDEKTKLETSGRVCIWYILKEEMSTPYTSSYFSLLFIDLHIFFCCGCISALCEWCVKWNETKKQLEKHFEWVPFVCVSFLLRIHNALRTRNEEVSTNWIGNVLVHLQQSSLVLMINWYLF